MEMDFYRPEEWSRERRFLTAQTYNLAHTLLTRSGLSCLFVPIRPILYLAVLDSEEFIFIDRQSSSQIEISWQSFRPQARWAIDQPVPYEAVYYRSTAILTMKRLQEEFYRALQEFAARQRITAPAEVIPFPSRGH